MEGTEHEVCTVALEPALVGVPWYITVKSREIPHLQRTPGWYAARLWLITASDIANFLTADAAFIKAYGNLGPYKPGKPLGHFMTKEAQIFWKASALAGKPRPFKGNVYTKHGQLYESRAIEAYTKRTHKKVYEFNLVVHATVKFLGCSPDGITADGRMVEIKCPMRRKITGAVPPQYWCQVQVQLACCNLLVCDYYECTYDKEGRLVKDNLVTIYRDDVWIAHVIKELTPVWEEVVTLSKRPDLLATHRCNPLVKLREKWNQIECVV